MVVERKSKKGCLLMWCGIRCFSSTLHFFGLQTSMTVLPLTMQLLKDFSVMLNFMTFHLCLFLMTLENSLHKENSFKHGQEGKVWLLIPWGISSFHESDTCKNVNTYSAWMLCLPEVCLDSQTLLSICVLLHVCISKCSSVPLLCPCTVCSSSQPSYERLEL